MIFYQPKEATTHGCEYGSYEKLRVVQLMEESKKIVEKEEGKNDHIHLEL